MLQTGVFGSSLRSHCKGQRDPSRKDDQALAERLRTVAILRPRWGSRRVYRRLDRWLRRVGLRVNRQRVQRVSREAGLHVRQRVRKRGALERVPKPAITGANQRGRMDVVSDALADGRRCRTLTVVDDATRECLLIAGDRSLPAECVIAALDRVARSRSRGYAPSIVCDIGAAFRSEALDQWADQREAVHWQSTNG